MMLRPSSGNMTRAMNQPENSLRLFLEADHARLDALWAECRALWGRDPAAAARVFQQFKTGLERHIAWEDELVFPAHEQHAGRPPDSLTALLTWEHRYLKRYLERLERLFAEPMTGAPLEWVVFEGMLAGHNRREEQLAYPQIEQTLSEPERRELLAAMQSVVERDDPRETGAGLLTAAF